MSYAIDAMGIPKITILSSSAKVRLLSVAAPKRTEHKVPHPVIPLSEDLHVQ